MKPKKQNRDRAERKNGQGTKDLWKPGPLSGYSETNPSNKLIARRIARRIDNRKTAAEAQEQPE